MSPKEFAALLGLGGRLLLFRVDRVLWVSDSYWMMRCAVSPAPSFFHHWRLDPEPGVYQIDPDGRPLDRSDHSRVSLDAARKHLAPFTAPTNLHVHRIVQTPVLVERDERTHVVFMREDGVPVFLNREFLRLVWPSWADSDEPLTQETDDPLGRVRFADGSLIMPVRVRPG